MAVAALAIAVLAIIFSLVPSFIVTQMVGATLGVVALLLGLRARREALCQGKTTRVPSAAVVGGAVALLLSGVVFASCQVCTYSVAENEAVQREMRAAREQFKRKVESTLRQTPSRARSAPEPGDGSAVKQPTR